MLEKSFEKLYLLFRASYYKQMVEKIGTRDGSLSATESFCVEIIYLLNRPTISQFAKYLNISVPNANYKLGCLVDKGYVLKVPSNEDKREYHLEVTDKFLDYYGMQDNTISSLMQAIRKDFSEDEVEYIDATIQKFVKIMQEENE